MYKSIILIFCFIIAINAQNIFELVKLPIEVNNVNSPRCLDGSAAGYYKRIGTDGGKTVMIHLEGGGWCTSYEDCLARSNTDIGSSKNWPLSGVPSMDGGSNGMFSNNCTINPQFCKVSMFHFNYCDGASHAGHQDHAIPVTKNNQYYGLAIGLTVAAGAFSVGEISGGVFNPAVSFGPSVLSIIDPDIEFANIVSHNFFIYYLGATVFGSLLASLLFNFLLKK